MSVVPDSTGLCREPAIRARVVGRSVKILVWLAVVSIVSPLVGIQTIKPTDYQQELGRVRQDIAAELSRTANDPQSPLRRAYLYFVQASLTGTPGKLVQAETEIDKSIRAAPFAPQAYLLKASIYLKQHRLDRVKAALEHLSASGTNPQTGILRADIAVQEGLYTAAENQLKESLGYSPNWDILSRLAYLRWKAGDYNEAERLYQSAQEQISAKEMRAYAWVVLQRGLMALNRGRHDLAQAHYRHADQSYSGYWLVQDYQAELLGAQRRFTAAAALYQTLIACTRRPEFYHALGDLYAFMGRPDRARPWHDKARALYLDSARSGEVLYYHHLASLFADSPAGGAEAEKWARLDLKLRTNATTRDTLAWALYRNGQYAAALEEMQKALASGWQDAHLFFHAGMIHLAAGQTQQGKQWLRRAAEINPHYKSFHVHR